MKKFGIFQNFGKIRFFLREVVVSFEDSQIGTKDIPLMNSNGGKTQSTQSNLQSTLSFSNEKLFHSYFANSDIFIKCDNFSILFPVFFVFS